MAVAQQRHAMASRLSYITAISDFINANYITRLACRLNTVLPYVYPVLGATMIDAPFAEVSGVSPVPTSFLLPFYQNTQIRKKEKREILFELSQQYRKRKFFFISD